MPLQRLGVVLFQLGGPDRPEAIEPFLYNLFCDPEIIDFPLSRIGRKPLAKLISTARARKVAHHYAVLGGGSPIRRFTEAQALALERELRRRGFDARCVIAMRYWHPLIEEAVRQIRAMECDELVLLPLYPQFSSTTTGSSLNEWARRWGNSRGRVDHPSTRKGGARWGPRVARVHTILDFYRDASYLDALVEKINETLALFDTAESAELVFSAHSVPVAVIERGDPYQQQVQDTVELVMRRGGWRNRHRLCWQSKVGASKWLQPSLRSTVRELGAAGACDVCVVPISFVSDHVETLGEIDHEARQLAAQVGIRRFEMTPGLNDSPRFIAALAALVMRAVKMESRQETAELVGAD